MDIDQLSSLIAQKRTELGQRIANVPNMEGQYRQELFGNDRQLASLYENENTKIQELYEHDKRLATYADPNSPTYMKDPYAREVARAKQHQGTVGELSDIQTQRSKRKDVLGDALDRAMKMLEYGLKAQELELSGLESDRSFAQRQKESGPNGSGDLTDLFNAIMGLQTKAKAVAPAFESTTVTKARTPAERMALEKRIRDQHKGKEIKFTFNKDGTITYAVLQPNQQIASAEEAPALQNIDETIRKLVAATGAANPKLQGEANTLYETLFPPTAKVNSTDAQQSERLDLVNTLPSAGDPNFANTDPNQLFLQARSQAKFLSDSEIKQIMQAKGWPVF